RDMTELTAEASGPAMKPAVDDHAAAYPRPHREKHEGLGPAPGAPAPLGQRERVDVVVHEGGRACRLGEELRHGNTRELWHMMRLSAHRAGRRVHEAGQPRSHADEAMRTRVGQRGHLGGEGEDALDRVSTIRPMGRPAARHEHPPVYRDEAGGHAGAAHVHAEEHAGVGTMTGHDLGRGPRGGWRDPATTEQSTTAVET